MLAAPVGRGNAPVSWHPHTRVPKGRWTLRIGSVAPSGLFNPIPANRSAQQSPEGTTEYRQGQRPCIMAPPHTIVPKGRRKIIGLVPKNGGKSQRATAQRRNGDSAQRPYGDSAQRRNGQRGRESSGAALQPLHIHAIRCAVFIGFNPHRQLLRVYRQAVKADAQLDESLHDVADD